MAGRQMSTRRFFGPSGVKKIHQYWLKTIIGDKPYELLITYDDIRSNNTIENHAKHINAKYHGKERNPNPGSGDTEADAESAPGPQ